MLLVEVGEAVADAGARPDGDIGDLHVCGDGHLLAEEVAVLIAAVIAVIVAEEVDLVAHMQRRGLLGIRVEIALGHGFGLAVHIDAARADNGAVGVLRVEADQQLHPLAVEHGGDIAGDDGVAAFAGGVLMIVGHRLTVDREPGIVLGGEEVALFIEGEDVVVAHIDVAAAVVHEHVQIQPLDQRPLLVGQGDDQIAGAVLRPVQADRVKAVVRKIGHSVLGGHRAVGEEAGVAAGQAGDRAVVAAEEGAEQLADHVRAVIGGVRRAGAGAVSVTRARAVAGARTGAVEAAEDRGVGVAGAAGGRLSADLQARKVADALGVAGVQADGVVGLDGRVHAAGLAVREVDGQAVAVRHVGAGAVVFDGALQGLGQRRALLGTEVFGEVHQVDLVDHGAAGKLARVVAGRGDLSVAAIVDQTADGLGEGLHRSGHRMRQLRQIDHGEGRGLAAGLALAGGYEVVHDVFADLGGRHGGVGRKLGKPVGVVPADAGLGLLGGDHVVGILVEHEPGLHRGHQAGVEADEVKAHARVAQGGVDAGEGHGAAALELLVVAVAADGAAAVIPEDQLVAVGGVVLVAPLDKGGQRGGAGHGDIARVGHQTVKLAVLGFVDLVDAVGHDLVVPAGAAAGVDDHVHIVGKLRLGHLDDVLGAHRAAGLQIRAAHVDHDGHGVLALALDNGALGAGTGGHVVIHRAGVGVDVAAAGRRGRGAAAAAGGCCAAEEAGIGIAAGGRAAENALQRAAVVVVGARAAGRRCRIGAAVAGAGLLGVDGLRALSAEHAGAEQSAAAEEQHRRGDDAEKAAASGAGRPAVIPAASAPRSLSEAGPGLLPADGAGVQPFAAAVDALAVICHIFISALRSFVHRARLAFCF